MCAGKSTVGQILADRLGWEFLDFDELIERGRGRTIADIFREHGEQGFRALEAELTEAVEGRRGVVLAPGGGWVTQAGLVERLREGSLLVWLRVAAERVLERHRRQANVERPLLAVAEPLDEIRSILAAREPFYRTADVIVETDGRDPANVAEEIVVTLRRRRKAGRETGQPLTSS
jgi:shikimate kinase